MRTPRKYIYQYKYFTIKELAALANVSVMVMKGRLYRDNYVVTDRIMQTKLIRKSQETAKRYLWEGQYLTIAELSRMCKISYLAMYHRIKNNNYKITDKIFRPKRKLIFIKNEHGKMLTLTQIAHNANLDYDVVKSRYNKDKTRTVKNLSAPLWKCPRKRS